MSSQFGPFNDLPKIYDSLFEAVQISQSFTVFMLYSTDQVAIRFWHQLEKQQQEDDKGASTKLKELQKFALSGFAKKINGQLLIINRTLGRFENNQQYNLPIDVTASLIRLTLCYKALSDALTSAHQIASRNARFQDLNEVRNLKVCAMKALELTSSLSRLALQLHTGQIDMYAAGQVLRKTYRLMVQLQKSLNQIQSVAGYPKALNEMFKLISIINYRLIKLVYKHSYRLDNAALEAQIETSSGFMPGMLRVLRGGSPARFYADIRKLDKADLVLGGPKSIGALTKGLAGHVDSLAKRLGKIRGRFRQRRGRYIIMWDLFVISATMMEIAALAPAAPVASGMAVFGLIQSFKDLKDHAITLWLDEDNSQTRLKLQESLRGLSEALYKYAAWHFDAENTADLLPALQKAGVKLQAELTGYIRWGLRRSNVPPAAPAPTPAQNIDPELEATQRALRFERTKYLLGGAAFLSFVYQQGEVLSQANKFLLNQAPVAALPWGPELHRSLTHTAKKL